MIIIDVDAPARGELKVVKSYQHAISSNMAVMAAEAAFIFHCDKFRLTRKNNLWLCPDMSQILDIFTSFSLYY